MPYSANVIEVMIVSPGDVDPERDAVRDEVHEWNNTHSRERRFVLLPTGWETHTAPLYDKDAQTYIDEEVLDHADLVVAIFKHRVGSLDEDKISGSIHELAKHAKAGKPALIYFYSGADASKETPDQTAALRAFTHDARGRGLVGEFTSLTDLKYRLAKDLQRTLRHVPALKGLMDQSPHTQVGHATVTKSDPPPLMAEAEQMLLAMAPTDSQVILSRTSGPGTRYQVNQVILCDGQSGRISATWDNALKQLRGRNLIEAVGSQERQFKPTRSGFDMADQLLERYGEAPPTEA